MSNGNLSQLDRALFGLRSLVMNGEPAYAPDHDPISCQPRPEASFPIVIDAAFGNGWIRGDRLPCTIAPTLRNHGR
ncbi:MAG: hypothetical protein P8Q50_11155 [Octadecabacter sp.]|nr:hypothetical protein [Octadecabacter sp.]